MSNRKPGYVIGVLLTTLVMSAPQIFMAGVFTVEFLKFGLTPIRTLPGLGSPVVAGSVQNHSSLWKGKFVYIGIDVENGTSVFRDGAYQWSLHMQDAETAQVEKIDLKLKMKSYPLAISFQDRLWLVGTNEAYEIVDNVAQPASMPFPTWSIQEDGRRLLWKDEPALIEHKSPHGFFLSSLQQGRWQPIGLISTVVDSSDAVATGGAALQAERLQAYEAAGGLHLFLHRQGQVYHRRGLELEPVPPAVAGFGANPVTIPLIDAGNGGESVSALRALNTDGRFGGWTLIRQTPTSQTVNYSIHTHGLLIAGKPAALIVDKGLSGDSTARLYRKAGTEWNEVASLPLPFGAWQFRSVVPEDGQKSHFVVTTSTGDCHVFAVEGTGFRQTKFPKLWENQAIQSLIFCGALPMLALFSGVLLGLAVWGWMAWWTTPDYGFGLQDVKLASLGWRGLARLIDLGLILFSTVALGCVLSLGFSWLTVVEAINLKLDHPVVPRAIQVGSLLALWLVIGILTLIVVQGRWGVTPGKWLCGLRILRTTLRPCGFARSLVREVVCFVDNCNFLYWAPGIVSIAFTNCRQRLGDLVADTLVVEHRSLSVTRDKPHPQSDPTA